MDQQIWREEVAARLKMRLFQAQSPDHTQAIPPPTATKLMFAGDEIKDTDTFEKFYLEEGAELTLKHPMGLNVTLRIDGEEKSGSAVVWPGEILDDAISRVSGAVFHDEAKTATLSRAYSSLQGSGKKWYKDSRDGTLLDIDAAVEGQLKDGDVLIFASPPG